MTEFVLPDRAQFNLMAEQALARAVRQNWHMAFLILGIEVAITDQSVSEGEVTAALILHVAEQLRSAIRKSDTLAHLGGTEFVVIADSIEKPEDMGIVAAKITRGLAGPFKVKGQAIPFAFNMGIAIYPYGGGTVSDLLHHADMALTKARKTDDVNYQYFTEKFNQKIGRRLRLESALRGVLARKELTIYYQPIFNLDDGALYGAEALLRWPSPEFGDISPVEIVPILEDSGLIIPIGYWIIETVLRQHQAWEAAGYAIQHLSINVSPKQLMHKNWNAQIDQLFSGYQSDASSLIFELTETAILTNLKEAGAALMQLRARGCRIFVDDFGTGYSSLDLLRQLPIAGLKVDQSFVADVQDKNSNTQFLDAVLVFAHSMGLTVVTEGIETKYQLEFLKKYPNQKGQGFYLGRPMPAEAFEQLLQKQHQQ